MADANETERAWFIVQGTVRGGVVDKSGNEREYVVLGNNFRDNLREVVRCRDCKYSGIQDESTWPANKKPEYAGMTYCIAWSDGMQAEWTEPDGFCHRGRKVDA